MRLQHAQVQNYKSIIDSKNVEIEPEITALVGRTGSGKTSFLEMLEGVDPAKVFHETQLPNGSDTKQKFSNGVLKASEILQLTAIFAVESGDESLLPKEFTGVNTIEVNRYFDGHFEIKTPKGMLKQGEIDLGPFTQKMTAILEGLKSNLAAAVPRVPNLQQQQGVLTKALDDFAQTNLKNVKELDLYLQSLRNAVNVIPKDAPFQNELNSRLSELQGVRDEIGKALEQDPVKRLLDVLPKPTLKRDVFALEDRMRIDDFINKPESSRTFQCIAIIGGLVPSGVQKIRNATPAEKEAYLGRVSSSLSEQLSKFWTQEKYDFKVSISGDELTLTVSDRTTGTTTSVLEGSDGFKWFTSFFLEMSADQSQKSGVSIVLLDNPATSLHDEGKGDVLRFLNKTAESGKIQLLYATHERPLIDPWRMDRIRAVEKKHEGTEIDRVRSDSRLDLLERIRRNIGSPAKYSLFGAPRTVAFEGISDMNIISAFNEYLDQQGSPCLHKDLFSLNAINGIDNAPDSCHQFKKLGFDFVIVVDSGQETEDMKSKLGEDDFQKYFIQIKDVIGRDGDTEDLVDPNLYYSAFKIAYEGILDDLPALVDIEACGMNRKRTNQYDQWFEKNGKEFNKTLVAQQMFKVVMTRPSSDKSVKEFIDKSGGNFVKLFEFIADRLR